MTPTVPQSPPPAAHAPSPTAARTRRRRIAAVAFLVLSCLGIASACSPGQAADATTQGQHELENLTPFAKDILKDKKVSLGELLEATQNVEQCLTAHKIQWMQDNTGPNGYLGPASISTEITALESEPTDSTRISTLGDAATQCHDHADPIESVWILQHPTSQREVDRAKTDLPRCLATAGLNVAPDASFGEANDAFRVYVSKNLTSGAPTDPKMSEALKCEDVVQRPVGVVAPTGLADALAALDTSGW